MKKLLVFMIALVAFSLPVEAKEKKEKWFDAGVKPDPTLTIPFIGVKAPLPTACIGKDVSASSTSNAIRKVSLLSCRILSLIGISPVFL